MRLLYVIFVLSVAALIWMAFAVAHHIRRHESHRSSPATQPQPELEAVEERNAEDAMLLGAKASVHGKLHSRQ